MPATGIPISNSQRTSTSKYLGIVALLAAVLVAPAVAADDHLLLCEAVVTPTANEFIEIANPTGAPVDLANYYLSDDEDYALLPGASSGGPAPSIGSSDFIVQFPPGAMIPAGGVVVVAFDGAGFITAYGFAADFEIFATDAGTPDMVPTDVGSGAGLTNSGENAVLFLWDGLSDLVSDVDMTNIGTPSSTNDIGDKTGVSVDGPDSDTTASMYLSDLFTMPPQVGDPGLGTSTKRVFLETGNEATGGGNGLTGDDETTEQITTTWDGPPFSAPDPGTCAGVTAALPCGGDNALIKDRIFPDGEVFVCEASLSVSTMGTVTVQSGADVSFYAPQIVLSADFIVEASGTFTAGTMAPVARGLWSVPTAAVKMRGESALRARPAVRLSSSQLPLELWRRLVEAKARVSDLASDAESRFVVLATDAALLVDDVNGLTDVYLYETKTRRMRLVSRSLAGWSGFRASTQPRIDGAGTTIVFVSEADDLIADDSNGIADVYRYDIRNRTTNRISMEMDGTEAWRVSRNPALDSGGVQILYDRLDVLDRRQVYSHLEPDTQRYSLEQDPAGTLLDNHHPGISADGRFIAHVESASGGPVAGACMVRVFDQLSGSSARLLCPPGLVLESHSPYFSSDNSQIVWVEDQGAVPVGDPEPEPRVVVVANPLAAGKQVRTSFEEPE